MNNSDIAIYQYILTHLEIHDNGYTHPTNQDILPVTKNICEYLSDHKHMLVDNPFNDLREILADTKYSYIHLKANLAGIGSPEGLFIGGVWQVYGTNDVDEPELDEYDTGKSTADRLLATGVFDQSVPLLKLTTSTRGLMLSYPNSYYTLYPTKIIGSGLGYDLGHTLKDINAYINNHQMIPANWFN